MTARARHLFPTHTVQCEAMRAGKYANDTPETDKRCKTYARFKIKGHNFCRQHAEIAALQILLEESISK